MKVIQPMIPRITVTCYDDLHHKMAAINAYVCETISEDKLVVLWQQFPCLYDIRSEVYRNRDVREQAIKQIAEEVQQSGKY